MNGDDGRPIGGNLGKIQVSNQGDSIMDAILYRVPFLNGEGLGKDPGWRDQKQWQQGNGRDQFYHRT